MNAGLNFAKGMLRNGQPKTSTIPDIINTTLDYTTGMFSKRPAKKLDSSRNYERRTELQVCIETGQPEI